MDDTLDVDRIVVGVDGSDSSVDALRYAARLAEAFDAPLEALITWTFPLAGGMPPMEGWYPEQIAADDLDTEVFVRDPVPFEVLVVEEMAERAVPHVVQQPGQPRQALDVRPRGHVPARIA